MILAEASFLSLCGEVCMGNKEVNDKILDDTLDVINEQIYQAHSEYKITSKQHLGIIIRR